MCIRDRDYVFVHRSQMDAFVKTAKAWAAEHLRDIHDKDYSCVIDDRSFKRLQTTLQDAEEKGARIINLHGDQKPDASKRKMPLQLVLDTTPEMTIRQRETFGPVLTVLPYDRPEDVIDYVRSHDRPLAMYPFSKNRQLVDRYVTQIMSGGVTVNDALYHVAQHDLPFGGVGASGMGHYHSREGFETFSKLRPVFEQAPFSAMKLLQPPYGRFADRVYGLLVKLKA